MDAITVKEVKQSYGDWTVRLRDYTPRELLDKIQGSPFGHIAVIPGRINPAQYGDGLLALARYVGPFRAFFNQPDGHFEIKGTGMALWLGDEDGKGDVIEGEIVFANDTFADTIRDLLPTGGAITEGTFYSVPGGQLYTGKHKYQSRRQALTYVTDTFSTPGTPVEWRVNGDGTLDAGPVANLYRITPRAILVEREAGQELMLAGVQSLLSNDYDVEDYTTRVVLLGEGEGNSIAVGTADGPPTAYRDIHGNPVKLTRIISEGSTTAGNVNERAQVELNRRVAARRAVQLSSSDYDIKGQFVVGDYVYVFDPDSGFVDNNNEVYWQGIPINPMALRVVEMSWPIRANWTLAFRTKDGEWLDLSEYYQAESGSTYIVVGDFLRTLAGGGGEQPINVRPIVGDSSIPAAPVFGTFSVGSYQSGQTNTTKAAIRAQWNTPLNTDGSTVLDGDHYEIRFRISNFIGYTVKWGALSGYQRTGDDNFDDRTLTGSWGSLSETAQAWTVVGGTVGTDYGVDDDAGYQSHSSTNVLRTSHADLGFTNGEVTVEFTTPVVPTGATITHWTLIRMTDTSNYYTARLDINTAGSVTITLFRRVANVLSGALDTLAGFATHTAGTRWKVRINCHGSNLRAMAWKSTATPPTAWQVEVVDTTITTGTRGGFITRLESGNTNSLPVVFTVHKFVALDLGNTIPGYKWGELAGNHWGAPVSEPVNVDPEWITLFVGWGTNEFTIQELTPGVTYELQIRGVDNAVPPHQGPWSPSSFVTTTGDIFAPSAPAAPTVAASTIAIQVTHQLGKNSGGTFNLESDLDHLNVYVGGSDQFTPNDGNKVGELAATAGMIQQHIASVGTFPIDETGDIWIKVIAVDRSGNKSGASPAVQSTAVLVDDSHISNLSVSKLTAGTITANSVLAAMIEVGTGGNVTLNQGALHVKDALGNIIVRMGLLPDGLYGFRVDDTEGNPQIRAGELAGGGHGLEAVNLAGQLVSLSTLAFGVRGASSPFQGTVSGLNYVDLTGAAVGPSVTTRIGSSGQAIVILTTDVFVGQNAGGSTDGYMSFNVTNEHGSIVANADDGRSLNAFMPNNIFDDKGAWGGRMSVAILSGGLGEGERTFTAKYRAGNIGVAPMEATFFNRNIIVLPY